MKIKMKLSKQEKIMALLNQWDPTGEFASSQDYRIYSFEADTIAQNIRSNSKVETIERVIKEVFSDAEILLRYFESGADDKNHIRTYSFRKKSG